VTSNANAIKEANVIESSQPCHPYRQWNSTHPQVVKPNNQARPLSSMLTVVTVEEESGLLVLIGYKSMEYRVMTKKTIG